MNLARRPTAIIAEDEAALAAELREQLERLWPELDIVAIAEDGIGALRAIDEHDPEIVFLDIRMPNATGLEVARHASGKRHIVFVTAFDDYAVDAFEHGAIDYVRKPITAARLSSTVQRVRERLGAPPREIAALLQQLAGAAAPRERTWLRWIKASRGDQIVLITVEDVAYFKAEDKYTVVVTSAGEALIRRSIKDLLDELDPDVFWQIHRATVVNANAIANIRRDLRGHMEVRLKNRPEALPVAEPYQKRFRQM